MRYLVAEARKLAGVRAAWVGAGITLVVPPGVAALNGSSLARAIETGNQGVFLSLSTADSGFMELTIGVIGILVIAVTSVSSEFVRTRGALGRTRQVSSTLTALPDRGRLGGAKVTVLVGGIVLLAAVAIPATLATSRFVLGRHASAVNPWHGVGVAGLYVTMGLLAQAITTLARGGLVPLVVLIANSSVVSLGMLALQVTPWARYLPDIAATSLVLTNADFPAEFGGVTGQPLPPGSAAWTLLAWSVLAVVVTVAGWIRRDA